MRIAIVGAGSIFDHHISAYRSLGAEVVAVVDVDGARARRTAEKYNIQRHATAISSILGEGVDIVDICTPPKFHREIAFEALALGKHVVCEKPLAANLREIDELIAAERESNGCLSVVHQLRFANEYRRAKWLIDDGLLGEIVLARVARLEPPPMQLVENGQWGGWDLAGGGVLMTKAIHQLDLLLWMLGPVRRVDARMGTYLYDIKSEDHLVANLEFESGVLGQLLVSGTPLVSRHEFALIGTKGYFAAPDDIRMHDATARTSAMEALNAKFPKPTRSGWHKLMHRVTRPLRRFRPAANQSSHREFLRDFLEQCANSRAPAVSAKDARRAVELCTALYASALAGKTVELPLDSSFSYYDGIGDDDYKRSISVRHAESSPNDSRYGTLAVS